MFAEVVVISGTLSVHDLHLWGASPSPVSLAVYEHIRIRLAGLAMSSHDVIGHGEYEEKHRGPE